MSRYYIRLLAKDVPGTVARYAQILGDNGISISGVLQHEKHNVGTSVGVIVTTHPAEQSKIDAALKTIKDLDVIDGEPVCIRIVDIPEDDLED